MKEENLDQEIFGMLRKVNFVGKIKNKGLPKLRYKMVRSSMFQCCICKIRGKPKFRLFDSFKHMDRFDQIDRLDEHIE
jgi:hypothetical protein